MQEGDIVILRIPQDTTGKLRPVLLLRKFPKFNDYLVCAISTQLRHYVEDFDVLIDEKDSFFSETGLLKTSLIKLTSIALVQETIIPGSIGKIPKEIHQQLLNNLSNYIKP